jgi:hypothetical protein
MRSWNVVLGRAGFRIARRIQRYHARVDTDGVSPLQQCLVRWMR